MRTNLTIKRVVSLVLAAVLVLAVTGCGAKSGKTMKFGTNAEFPPFEYISYSGVFASYEGIDMSIAKEIATRNDCMPAIENMEFDDLLAALKNGQVDAVIAGMTITEERLDEVDFSHPYYVATQVMLVKEDSDIETASDMADKKICVMQGYTGEKCVEKLGYSAEPCKKGTEAVNKLLNGDCDVVVIDSVTAGEFAAKNAGLKIVEDEETFENEEYGVAVKKGNTELLNKVNAVIDSMLNDGSIAALAVKYSEAE